MATIFSTATLRTKGGTHGQLGLAEAIKVSCNSYFYQMGNAAGINAIDHIGEALGLGEATGVEVTGEQPGVLPGPDWMRIHYPRERWTSAYTANVSIGQGYVLVSPLQMAMVYAALANGGIAYQPRLVKSVVGADGKPILNEKGQPVVSPNPKVRRDLRFDVGSAQIEQARRALYSVVNEGGTGGRARLPNVAVAGKTGSAQAMTDGKSDTIAWFAAFAPYNAPKYVVAIMVQGGKGGGAVAAPIANRILERVFAMDEAKFDPQLAWLEPARKPNPFQFLDSVDFKDSGLSGSSEDETNPSDAQTVDSQLAAAGPAPDVEPEADAAGRVTGKKVVRAVPVSAPPPRKLNFFERLFGIRPKPTPPPPPPPRRPPGRR